MTSPPQSPGRSSRRTRLMPIGSCSRSEPETALGAIDVNAAFRRRGIKIPLVKHPLFLDFHPLRCHLPAVGAAPREAALSFYAEGSVPREIRAMKALMKTTKSAKP